MTEPDPDGRLDAIEPALAAYRDSRRDHGDGLTVTTAQLDRMEGALGVALPAAYRGYLARFGTIGPGLLRPDWVVARAQSDHGGCAHVTRPFAIDGDRWATCCDDEPELVCGAIAVTEGGCDFFTVLAVTGELAGTVWTNDYDGSGEGFRWAPAGREGETEPIDFLTWIENWLAYEASRPPRKRWFTAWWPRPGGRVRPAADL